MKIDLKLERFLENNSNNSHQTMDINIANNPSMNKGLLDTIISNGTLNNYSDQELWWLQCAVPDEKSFELRLKS